MKITTSTRHRSCLLQNVLRPSEFYVPGGAPEIFHRLSAGFPSPAADYVEDTLDLNTYLVRHKAASYYFQVDGECMRDAGIFDGDKVLVDKSVTPAHGHIVVAVVDSEYTLKRLYWRDGIIELRPENADYKTIKICDGSELQVWGVVTAIIRKLVP